MPPQPGSPLLKAERRRLRITTGNAQELYFPVCFELAVTKGAPERDDRRGGRGGAARPFTRSATAPRSSNSTGTSTADEVIAKLSRQLDGSWRDVRAG